MAVEKEVLITPIFVSREDFGGGKAGQIAYLTIAGGAFCETIISDPKICERISDRTVGFDLFGNYELLPVCSDEHEKMTRERVEADLKKAGQNVSFDRNGFGRA